MVLVKFAGTSHDHIFRCIELDKRYCQERDKEAINGAGTKSSSNKALNKRINRWKKDVDLEKYEKITSDNSIEIIGQLEAFFDLRIDIYGRISTLGKTSIVRKMYKSSNNKDGKRINLFNVKFNQFSNPILSGMQLILDLSSFLEENKYFEINDSPQSEKMTLFQALTCELKPKLSGQLFFQEVAKNKVLWNKSSYHVTCDVLGLYKKFKLGFQIWTVKRRERKLKSKKVYDSKYVKKVIIEVPNFQKGSAQFDLDDMIVYYRDASSINYFSCDNNKCSYGTNDLTRYRTHTSQCFQETITTYKQKKYHVPENEIKEALVGGWKCKCLQ